MARSRSKRRRRPLSRAHRIAGSPRPPAGAILAYRLAIGRVAETFAARVRAATKGKLERFALRADAASPDSSDTLGRPLFDVGALLDATASPVDKAARHSKAEFRRVGISLPPKDEPSLTKLTASWRKAAADRAEAILENERETIVALLQSSENRTPEQLEERIEERLLVTKSKLQGAARDDVLTLNAQITGARQQAAGIDSFVWTTAGDGTRVRESHQALDGQTFPWSDPPIVDGEPAIPGEPPNCRCFAYPVLPELED